MFSIIPFAGEYVDGAFDVPDRRVDGKGHGVNLDAKQTIHPAKWCILEFVEKHRVILVGGVGITDEDEDGFNAIYDGLFDV